MGSSGDDYLDAFNVSLTEDESRRLAQSANYRVRLALAANPSLGRAATRTLLRDRYTDISFTVARNPKANVLELWTFLVDENAPNFVAIAEALLGDRDERIKFSFWRVCNFIWDDTPPWDYFHVLPPQGHWREEEFPFRWGEGVYGDAF